MKGLLQAWSSAALLSSLAGVTRAQDFRYEPQTSNQTNLVKLRTSDPAHHAAHNIRVSDARMLSHALVRAPLQVVVGVLPSHCGVLTVGHATDWRVGPSLLRGRQGLL